MLASASLQGLVAPSSHANRSQIFQCRRRPCWRGPPWKALLHRQAMPTGARFSSAGAAHVGVGLPGRPCCTVKPRQQELDFPAPAPPLLAWTFPQGLVAPSSHANRSRNFPCRRCSCWRGPPRKALFYRQATPIRPGISLAGVAHVGVGLPGRPCCTVKPRQQEPEFPAPAPPLLAWTFPQSLVAPTSHANKARNFPCRRYSCWRGPSRKVLFHRQATPTRP